LILHLNIINKFLTSAFLIKANQLDALGKEALKTKNPQKEHQEMAL
jgi:hypothetical protein